MPGRNIETIDVDIVEDQVLVRELLTKGLSETLHFRIRSTFDNAEEALKHWDLDPPAAVILDISLPGINGVNAGVRLKRMHSAVAVVLLSSHVFPNLLRRLPKDVAHGWAYLLKGDVTVDLLKKSIFEALNNVVIDGAASEELSAGGIDFTRLTTQQRKVLRFLSEGKSNDSIAREMGITRKSVENYVNRIFTLLNLGESDSEANRRVIAALAATKLLDIEP